MNAPLLTLVQWCSALAPIVYIRDSRYGMPAVQSVHLVGITMFLAAVLVLDARLAGIGVLDSSPIRLARQLKPVG